MKTNGRVQVQQHTALHVQ